MKTIDFRRTVYELCRDNPEIMDILKQIGFESITLPGMLTTAGRFMTIPKGAAMKGIDMEVIKDRFMKAGYVVQGDSPL